MERMGEEKLYFPLLKSVKRKKSPVEGEVSQLILSPIVANADTSSSTLCCNRSFLCEGEKSRSVDSILMFPAPHCTG